MDENHEGPLTPAELEMLSWNTPVLKANGRVEPPDLEDEYMLRVLAAAKAESGCLRSNLDELARIARMHNQFPNEGGVKCGL